MIPPCATSRPFVATENFLVLARVAEAWCCRPSDLLGLQGDIRRQTIALQLDLAGAAVLWQWKRTLAGESEAFEEW